MNARNLYLAGLFVSAAALTCGPAVAQKNAVKAPPTPIQTPADLGAGADDSTNSTNAGSHNDDLIGSFVKLVTSGGQKTNDDPSADDANDDLRSSKGGAAGTTTASSGSGSADHGSDHSSEHGSGSGGHSSEGSKHD